MANVYSAPSSLGDPPDFSDFRGDDGRYDFKAHMAAEEAWIETVKEAARAAHPKSDIAGKTVYFPVADGSAVYVIWDGKSLIHCPVGDAWHIPAAHARGLRASDLRAMVTGPALFGEKD